MELARGCERILFVQAGMVAADGDWAALAASNQDFAAWTLEGEQS